MPSIYDAFRNMMNPGNRQSQSMDPNQNPNLNPNVDPNTVNPNTLPQNQQQQQNPQNNQQQQQPKETPADAFKDLWTIDPKQKGPTDLADFSFQFDPKKVDASINGLDFTKTITPELAQKIAAGGADAVAAMFEAMNIVGRQAAKTALIASTQVTENGIRTSGQRIRDNLPHLVRNEAVNSALREDNPLFSDPSTAPMMEVLTQQMAQKFPNATPAEIRESAKKYMVNFATNAAQFTGKQLGDAPSPSTTARSSQTDWSNEPI